jgi:hypothetical protein
MIRNEISSLTRFIFDAGNKNPEILFYSSQAQYISYYEGLLKELVGQFKKSVLYLSSDRNDAMLNATDLGITPYYSKLLLSVIFPMIDLPVLVTTIPDLHQYKIKRSFLGTNHVYVFHSLVSTHMMYRFGAFDYFDTIFCAGPYQASEIRHAEILYNLPRKAMHEVGYYRLEKIYNQHKEYLLGKKEADSAGKLILIAPGWHETNILNVCAEELVHSLLVEGFKVVLRPHPMTIMESMRILEKLRNKFANAHNFYLDVETVSEKYLHSADVMISDWSGVTLEYALGTERPVLFIDLPRKIYNPEYEKLGIMPLEVKIREQIGKVVSPERAQNVGKMVLDFIDHEKEYRDKIVEVRQKNISNFGESSKVGTDIILDILSRGIKGRTAA